MTTARSLDTELERLIEVYSVSMVVAHLAIVCGMRASHEQARSHRVPAKLLQQMSADLMLLSEKAYAL